MAKNSLNPAPMAPDLVVARRLSLGLMGTVPSLEVLRQFERLPSGERLSWWVDHILDDRRYADYFAERLARACVGTEEGPFIFYRRRRLVAWLGDQLAVNRPYDHLVHDLIAGKGCGRINRLPISSPLQVSQIMPTNPTRCAWPVA